MNLIDLFLKEGKQYLMDAMPGGALNREVTPQGLLDATALATAPVPVVGDVAGLAADAKRMYDNPAERTPMNIGLSALGLLPFIPGATVFHGTPHLFNKFDSSKIGTGEGNQTYGYGLYLAENPSVAKEYSKLDPAGGLIPSPVRMIKGAQVQPGTGAYKAASLLDSMTLAQAKKTAKGWVETSRPEETAYFSEVLDTLNSIGGKRDVKISNKKPQGYLYQVDLPDEQIAKMLDFDKPLNKQSKPVRDALSKLGITVDDTKLGEYEDALLNALMTDAPTGPLPRQPMNMTGGEIIKELQRNPSRYLPQMMQGRELTQAMINPAQGASSVLRQAGIPGIRYLDEGSRGAGQGTSNFVVFPGMEDMLRIEQINNQPVESLFRSLGR